MRRLSDLLVVKRRARLWSALHPDSPKETGRFKKHGVGCLVTRCSVCKPHKYPKRTPSRQERIHERGNGWL